MLSTWADRVLTQPGLPQRVLKAIQDGLVRQLYGVDPLLIRLGIVRFPHGTSLFQLPPFSFPSILSLSR